MPTRKPHAIRGVQPFAITSLWIALAVQPLLTSCADQDADVTATASDTTEGTDVTTTGTERADIVDYTIPENTERTSIISAFSPDQDDIYVHRNR